MLRSREKVNNSLCLELTKNDKENVRINFLEVAKALLRVCKEAQIEVITRITRRGYKTYIRFSPNDDPIKCYELFKSLLAIYLPNNVKVNESPCSDVYDGKPYPFYEGLKTTT